MVHVSRLVHVRHRASQLLHSRFEKNVGCACSNSSARQRVRFAQKRSVVAVRLMAWYWTDGYKQGRAVKLEQARLDVKEGVTRSNCVEGLHNSSGLHSRSVVAVIGRDSYCWPGIHVTPSTQMRSLLMEGEVDWNCMGEQVLRDVQADCPESD